MLLFEQNDKKFKNEYLKKLKRNWNRWKNQNKKTEKVIWRDKKEVPLETEP